MSSCIVKRPLTGWFECTFRIALLACSSSVRVALGASLSSPRFPSEYLPPDTSYYKIVFEDYLVDVEVPSIRGVCRCDE